MTSERVQAPLVLIVSGPSGSGKSTLVQRLLQMPGTMTSPAQNRARQSSGIPWAVAAALGFGVLFWLLGTRIIPRTGALATIWMIRVTGTFITLAILLAQKTSFRVKNKHTSAQLYSMTPPATHTSIARPTEP